MADNGDNSDYKKIVVFENDLVFRDKSEVIGGPTSSHERIPEPDTVNIPDNGADSDYKKIVVIENDDVRDTSDVIDRPSPCHERIPEPDTLNLADNGDDTDGEEFVVVIENGVVVSDTGTPASAPRQKRGRNPDGWRMNIVKKLRNEGKAYISRKSNKLVEARKIGPACSNGCFERLTMPVVEALFKEYWALGDYNAQTAYLLNLMDPMPVKCPRTPNKKKNRTQTIMYHVMYGGVEHSVCKKGFCSIFGISDRRVRVALERSARGDPSDRRGKNPRVTKFVGPKADLVRTHIQNLPTMSSQCHLCAKSGDRVYLDSNLNIVRLHQMYLDFMREKHPEVETVSFNYYSNVFRTEFNIGFMPPVISCITCGLLIAYNRADRDNQRPGPSDDPSQSSTSRDESSRASTERGKKGPVTKTKLGQRKRKEAANVNTTGDEVNTQEQKKEDLRSSSRTNKGGGSRSRTSKRKRTPAKANDDLQEGGVEEKEDVEKEVNVKKLKVEEERPVEKEEEIEAKEEEIEEMSDSSDMIPFQEIKIEEEDPLDAPYPLDDEVNISEAPDVALTSGILFKREEPLPWMDKTDKDKSSIAVAEEDSSKKENKPGQSKTPKTGSKSKKADSKEKNSEDLEETHKNLRKSKVVGKQEKSPSDKQQKSPSNKQQKSPSNKQQEPPAAAEVTRKRCRKILREDSQSELSELSLQLTKDIYDVFGMHVAKTLRDINDIKVFNRVKIKINEILLDALAGYYSNPGFERETSEGKPILSQDHEISNNTDSSNQDLEKRTDMKKSSSANNDTHKTTLPLSDTDQTQAVSVDHSSSVSQHSRMPIQIINPPILLPVNSSNLKPSQSKTENTCQDSRTLQTTPFVHQPGTILVNFTFPLMAQSSVVDNSRTLPTTQSIQQPGTIPGNSSFPTVTQSSDLNDSRTLEAKSIYQPGTILVNSSCPDTTRASVLDPDDNSSHHSTITETFHGTDILGGDPNITTTGPVDSSSSRSQHCVLTKTEARGIDAAQTSTIHPHGSISQHSGSPVTGHDKTHHPQVPGKKIKKETDLNPLQS
ncbi:papilin-like isoform X2 [Palaemon carinicauda]|uniref:papilin-like isoform X2 n=1 Tax=Palaemon carinicauda TaxID=392227 RepID=UPI0035B5A092